MPSPDASTLHGSAPDRHPIALLLVDVINDMNFDEADELLRHALPAARRIATLAEQARALGIPVVYANDNFGRWRSDFREVVENACREDAPGHPVARLLTPREEDYFVLKPKHSAFHETTLTTLLHHLGTRRLVIAGFAGDICVLFTAHDAYMRDYSLHVPADCSASNSAAENEHALAYMRRVMSVDTTPSSELDLVALCRESGAPACASRATTGPTTRPTGATPANAREWARG